MNDQEHKFSSEAMDSPFELFICGHAEEYAASAAETIFREVDRLEQLLSRFVENSDISRIAALEAGESVVIINDTMDCLLTSLWAFKETDGAFDVSLGSGIEKLGLDTDNMTVSNNHQPSTINPSISLDLGGIGKGFALDRAAAILDEWEIENALLTAGPSTILGLGVEGEKEWSIGLQGKPVMLREQAISASGKAVKGDHIIDPRTKRPAGEIERAWAISPSAAVADALSTAFMVMTPPEVDQFCRKHEGVEAYLLQKDGEILHLK
ncbi:hypothetical protein BVX97_00530 [bacterium E08(2017)]|nr:hypothetical protein BVX97_00530 [bacterium E08(2017)]